MTTASHPAAPRAPKARWRISLRAFLSLLTLALSIVTVGGTGLIAYHLSYNELTELKKREFTIDNHAAAGEISRVLDDPASHILAEYVHRAQIGLLPLSDNTALGRELMERLRVRPDLAWISYSAAATGNFTGAWRARNNDIVLNHSSPAVNGGIPVDEMAAPDGSLVPYTGDKSLEPYDPRPTAWFRNAAASRDVAWSPPYDFADGNFGITASKAWRKDDSSPAAGVFTVDFYLVDLDREMGAISRRQNDFVSVFQTNGELLCGPKGYNRRRFGTALTDIIKSITGENPGDEYNRVVTLKESDGDYLVALHYLDTSTGLKCIVASLAKASDVYAEANRTAVRIGMAGLALLCVALVFGWGAAKRIARPLTLLSGDLEKIGDLDLSSGPLKRSIFRELQILIESSERMKSGLRSFMRYVPRDVVRNLLGSGHDAALGVEPKTLTIFFSDIENFTGYTEKIPPARLVAHLSAYFEILRNAVRAASGTIDKFIGDGLLVFFNAPQDVPDHERRACEAALDAVEKLNAAHGTGEGQLPFRTRIGLHTGEVLVGNIGTSERFAYTVLGDPVNTASRIENLNKVYGTVILASGAVREKAGDDFEWRHVDRVAVAGRQGALDICELLGVKDAVAPELLRARDLYEQAMKLYFAKNFAQARDLFASASEARPADSAAQIMAHRCDDLIKNHPGEAWDGVFIHTHK